MAQYYITNESTEDTLGSTNDLQKAIRIAKEAAQQGKAGDPVCVEREGKAIKQFILQTDGTVAEQAVA